MQTAATALTVRRMTRTDLDLALDWAAAEGWNPGLKDAASFFAADPAGYFVAELNSDPVGSLSAIAYDENFGFVGLYIVRPEWRARGCGRALFEAGLEYLGSRSIGLDGVPAQQEYYDRRGFRFAFHTLRYEGTSDPDSPGTTETPASLVDLRSFSLDELTTYDARIFPASRPKFLEEWIRQPGTTTLGALQLGRLAGYGILRPCRIGYKIGPLLADDGCLAEVLFEGLLATVPGETVFLDVPEPNGDATTLARRHGMKPVFNTARMYRGSPPNSDLKRTFGVTTLELG